LAIVALVVEGGGVALIVRRDDAPAEYRLLAGAMVDLGDAVVLREVLVRVADVLNHAEIRLENGVRILEARRELELIADRGAAGVEVVSGGDVDLVEHVVVEVVLIRPDP